MEEEKEIFELLDKSEPGEKLKKRVICYRKDRSKDIYDSMTEAAEENDVTRSAVSQCCSGKLLTVKGMTFRLFECDD